jgi:hypothetical protein
MFLIIQYILDFLFLKLTFDMLLISNLNILLFKIYVLNEEKQAACISYYYIKYKHPP